MSRLATMWTETRQRVDDVWAGLGQRRGGQHAAIAAAVVVATWSVVAVLGWTVDESTVFIGALTGLAYAVLGAGLILIYRATNVINFAHGEIGAFGASVLAKLVIDHDVNFFVAFIGVSVAGGLIGAVIELTVIRRLFDRPRIVLLVATIGISQLMFFASAVLPGVGRSTRFPTGFDLSVTVGNIVIRGEHVLMVVFVPAVVLSLSWFLNKTPYGMAIRAAAENPDAARLAGVSVRRVSTVVWILAGVLATATVVLVNPLRGVVVGLPTAALGPALLLRALAAGLVGRLRSLPLTVAGGLAIGIIEAVAFANVANPGTVDLLIFGLVAVLVLVRGAGSASEQGAWGMAGRTAPPIGDVGGSGAPAWVLRNAGRLALVAAVVLPLVFTSASRQFLFSRVVIFAIAGLSVVVITSWAGNLSLAQFAFVGLGAFTTAGLHQRGVPFAFAVFYGTVAGVMAAVVVGGPALRIKGLFLAVTTLGFAVAARGWIFPHDVFLEGASSSFVERGSWWFIDLADQRTYYYVCLAVLVVCFIVVSRLRGTGSGRSIVAVRENENAASAFTVSPSLAKLSAFAIAGGLAALAGGLLAGLRVQFAPADFGPEESLALVSMAIIGGLGSVWGAVLGAVYLLGVPALVGDTLEIRLLTSGVGLIFVLLAIPGGMYELVERFRDVLVRLSGGGSTDEVIARDRTSAPPIPARTAGDQDEAVRALDARGIEVCFGGLVAVDGVDIFAEAGEIVGLIGTNGAGKSTFMNAVGGYVPTSGGTIEIMGHDVTGMPPHLRARIGVGRVFQDARLFGDLTVAESISVALEARERSELVPSMLHLPPSRRAERAKRTTATELTDFLGLGRYANSFIADLSTGTRRIVELACLIAVDARFIMLDEPTAGVAQRETEAFGPLIKRIQRELGATMLIIEHDMPLVMSLSDRIYCMSAGSVIAEGDPDDIRRDPAVISAYLGTDARAIDRSDSLSGVSADD